ncbi:unannotated protein [freshwater metagenome]|uniref:Unannotated protein n=1 Tax=freshwater metagenome TaxID=449393 RepID=A0A6J6HNS9_9ZZZZ
MIASPAHHHSEWTCSNLRTQVATLFHDVGRKIECFSPCIGSSHVLQQQICDFEIGPSCKVTHPLQFFAHSHRGLISTIGENLGSNFEKTTTTGSESIGNGIELFATCKSSRNWLTIFGFMTHGATCRKPHSTCFTRLANDAGHFFNICGSCVLVTRTSFTHHIPAHCTMGNIRSDIHAVLPLINRIEIFGEGFPIPTYAFMKCSTRNVLHAFHELNKPLFLTRTNRSEPHTTVTDHNGGDTMTTRWFKQCVPTDLSVVMSMNIDEAGRDKFAGSVDFFGGFTNNGGGNFHNATVTDCNIGNTGCSPSAIDNHASTDQ